MKFRGMKVSGVMRSLKRMKVSGVTKSPRKMNVSRVMRSTERIKQIQISERTRFQRGQFPERANAEEEKSWSALKENPRKLLSCCEKLLESFRAI
ncbi:hypothetical protein Nepgr_001254 [Nepenthes gracilis]|uniref:Uncharacterized protein n=1 Tax=Nepenthes gracilis TaxID=150966 RepID=A0AAD3P2G9_NEPGR|nr:hypothetical protein Nepgr_001254 [Nepenthes gracilis]